MALRPPSVIHGASSGPTITPCGAEPAPSGTSSVSPVAGSSQPSRPVAWAVYQTPPSAAGATSCGCVPAGTGNVCMLRSSGPVGVGAGVGAAVEDTTGEGLTVADGSGVAASASAVGEGS